MTWEEYEALIYREVAHSQKRARVIAAIGACVGKRWEMWEDWPGSVRIADYVLAAIEDASR